MIRDQDASECNASLAVEATRGNRGPRVRASEERPGAARRTLRVCLVIGCPFDGESETEIEAAYLHLASLLRDAGHDVTLLDAGGPDVRDEHPRRGIDHREEPDVLRIALPESPLPLGGLSSELAVSYRVYLWLRDNDRFDVVHFPERGGAGFYALTARRQGLALGRTTCVVGLFGCSAWLRRASNDILRHESELERDFLERRTAEMADAVWAPHGDPFDWADTQGWVLPNGAEARIPPRVAGLGRWHEDLVRRTAEADVWGTADDEDAALPSISVCINHYNRPHLLRQALASIVDQEHSPLEVIVLDDGSSVEGVQAELDRIVEEFAFDRRGWRLIRQKNLYLGASRNALAREARGDYILFMDDDNVAKPHEVATFARVARHTDGDVFTCLLDMFEGNERPSDAPQATSRHLFTGAAFPLCVIRNTFGDSNALVRRRALIELGGYTEDRGVGHEDWEVYSKFALRGYRIEVIPEALFFYRTAPGSMSREMSMIRSHLRSLRPHLEQIPRPYHALIELAMGQLLARWGYLDPPVREAELLPLRYRVVDAINERIKCLGQMHRLAKRLILAGWR